MGSLKRGYRLVPLWLLLVSPVFAANISFLVIETGIREEGAVHESSNLWETGLLDVFFDAGHIVSNAPIMRLNKSQNKEIPDEARGNLEEAIQGGADFFILALLDYQGAAAANAPKIKPQAVSVRLFRTRPYKLLYEQFYSDGAQTPGNDELTKAKGAARSIIPHLGKR
ncbi:MAG: hypothetical protein LBD65_05515 [Spirochaetaceae bacterium]|jgi:hypothetical protein|nr:hypothetical protein [Spirochaetaceae bacterium]